VIVKYIIIIFMQMSDRSLLATPGFLSRIKAPTATTKKTIA
jgi:hypothetical protein